MGSAVPESRQRAPALPMILAALLMGAAFVMPGSHGAASAQTATSSSSASLQRIADEVWRHTLESPGARLEQSLPILELPRWSRAKAEADAEFARGVLQQLESLDMHQLSHEESLTLAIVRWNARNDIEAAKYFWLQFPVTPYAGYLPTVHRILQSFRFQGSDAADRYLDLLTEYPRVIEEIQGHLRRQNDRGIVLPIAEVDLVAGFLQGFVREPAQSLFSVSDQRLAGLDPQVAARFNQQLAAEIDTRINPALERLIAYVTGPYRDHAPESVGLWQYPGGTDYYRYLVKMRTTTDATPEEIHELGLREVARLQRERTAVRKQLGFRGTKAEFHQFLRTDPRFFPKTADQIRTKLLGYANSIDRKLDTLFLTRPQAPFDTRRLDPALEGSMAFGYYERPRHYAPVGTYYFNGSKLEQRSLLQLEALIYHELVPGHHLQIAGQKENEGLHPLRKNFLPTAFTEGWASYASLLGRELGQYQDPYSLYGYLSLEMMSSVRLVVDTGMNHLKWSRARAIEYMREHLLWETGIETETLRYSADIPAQALAYQMGEIRMLELRDRARTALGSKFDIRRFHQAVIGSGALPLTVLDQHVDWYIAQEKALPELHPSDVSELTVVLHELQAKLMSRPTYRKYRELAGLPVAPR